MKKQIVIICISLFAVTSVAQEKFTVPALTDVQIQTVAGAWNTANLYIVS